MIGDIMKSKRKELGLSRFKLAVQIGITEAYVQKIENMNTYPSVPVLVRIADVFECSVDELLERDVFQRV